MSETHIPPPEGQMQQIDADFIPAEALGWSPPSPQEALDRGYGEQLSTVTMFDELTSDTSREKMLADAEAELSTGDMLEIAGVEQRITAITKQIQTTESLDERMQLGGEADRLRDSIWERFGSNAQSDFDLLHNTRKRLTRGESVIAGKQAVEVARLFLREDSALHAPEGTFIHETQLPTSGKMLFIELGRGDDHLQIPLDSIVAASGFESWEGRGDNASKEKIAEYASRSTNPIIKDELYGFILPDEKIVYMTGNAHRVAAAKKKQQDDPEHASPTIDFNGSFRLVHLDAYPPGLEQAT